MKSSSDGSSSSDYILFHDNTAGSFQLELFGCPVSLRQSPASRDLGHGAVVWEASVIFAKYMEHHGGKLLDLKGKTAIELGSGCGLGGLALAMRGARVVMTDLPCVVESLTAPNAQSVVTALNSHRLSSGADGGQPIIRPVVAPLDWTRPFECPEGAPAPPYDLVLLTDCVFSAELSPSLVDTIVSVAGPKTEVYCCYEIRDEHVNGVFLEVLSARFSWRRVPRQRLHPGFRNDMVEIIVCKLLKK